MADGPYSSIDDNSPHGPHWPRKIWDNKQVIDHKFKKEP